MPGIGERTSGSTAPSSRWIAARPRAGSPGCGPRAGPTSRRRRGRVLVPCPVRRTGHGAGASRYTGFRRDPLPVAVRRRRDAAAAAAVAADRRRALPPPSRTPHGASPPSAIEADRTRARPPSRHPSRRTRPGPAAAVGSCVASDVHGSSSALPRRRAAGTELRHLAVDQGGVEPAGVHVVVGQQAQVLDVRVDAQHAVSASAPSSRARARAGPRPTR